MDAWHSCIGCPDTAFDFFTFINRTTSTNGETRTTTGTVRFCVENLALPQTKHRPDYWIKLKLLHCHNIGNEIWSVLCVKNLCRYWFNLLLEPEDRVMANTVEKLYVD